MSRFIVRTKVIMYMLSKNNFASYKSVSTCSVAKAPVLLQILTEKNNKARSNIPYQGFVMLR